MNLLGDPNFALYLERMGRTNDVKKLKGEIRELADDYEALRLKYNNLVDKSNARLQDNQNLTNQNQGLSDQLNNVSTRLQDTEFLSNKFQRHVRSVTDPEEGLTRFAELQVMNIERVIIQKMAPEFLDRDTDAMDLDLKRQINIKMLAYALAWYENLVVSQEYFGRMKVKLGQYIDSNIQPTIEQLKEIKALYNKANSYKCRYWPGLTNGLNNQFRDMKQAIITGEEVIFQALERGFLVFEQDSGVIARVKNIPKVHERELHLSNLMYDDFAFVKGHMLK